MRKKHNIADEQQAFDAQEKIPLKSCLRNYRKARLKSRAYFFAKKQAKTQKIFRSSGLSPSTIGLKDPSNSSWPVPYDSTCL